MLWRKLNIPGTRKGLLDDEAVIKYYLKVSTN